MSIYKFVIIEFVVVGFVVVGFVVVGFVVVVTKSGVTPKPSGTAIPAVSLIQQKQHYFVQLFQE